MSKSMLTGLAFGAVVITAGGTGALVLKHNGGLELSGPTYANITRVQPALETVRTLGDEIAIQQMQPVTENKIARTAFASAICGVLGEKISGGNGKKLATATDESADKRACG